MQENKLEMIVQYKTNRTYHLSKINVKVKCLETSKTNSLMIRDTRNGDTENHKMSYVARPDQKQQNNIQKMLLAERDLEGVICGIIGTGWDQTELQNGPRTKSRKLENPRPTTQKMMVREPNLLYPTYFVLIVSKLISMIPKVEHKRFTENSTFSVVIPGFFYSRMIEQI